MAVPVRRGDGGKHEEFSLPEEAEENPDVAMVGGDSEGADLDIDPSEDKTDWDVPKDKPTSREKPAEEFDQEDSRLAYEDTGEGPPEERESKSRRARRNARNREYTRQQAEQIDMLTQQLQQLGGVVQRLTYGQVGLAANSLDGQISSLEQALRMADQELADAVKTNNGDKYAEVNRLRDEVVARLWNSKQQRVRMGEGGQVQQPPQQQMPPPQQQTRPDPAVAEIVADKFDRFQDRFPWFDPTSPDADCNIVRAIDAELTTQGLQRHQTAFWQAMEQKMASYGLTPNSGEDDDERPARRPNGGGRPLLGQDVPLRRGGPPTGSGRSTRPNGGGFALSEWQRDALRDEGLLEDKLSEADIAKRDRIVSKWRKGAETLRRRMN
jgi:hypothetical protein